MKEMMKNKVFNWVLRFRKLAVVGYPVALLMCVPVGANGVQADSKDSNSPQLLAQASAPQAAAQAPTAARTLPIARQPIAASPTVLKEWAKTMHHTPAPKAGCFETSYPSTEWQETACAPSNGWRPAFPHKLNLKAGSTGEVGGTDPGNNDVIVEAPSGFLFKTVQGSFPAVNGVTSETGVGVAYYSFGGILGANEYTLQLNTNSANTKACGSYSYCQAWVQFVMATNTPVSLSDPTLTNQTEAFIESSLLNYGSGPGQCPTGWSDFGTIGPGDYCAINLPGKVIAWNPPGNLGQLPITDLSDLAMSGSAAAGGNDSVTVTYGGHGYTATAPDSDTDISSVWSQAEFNVVGNAGGSEAVFNGPTPPSTDNGSTVVVESAVTYTNGSLNAPTCVQNGGSTGEQNNFTFATPPGKSSPSVCCAYAGSGSALPNIQFVESNNANEWASCTNPITWGEPHITTVDGNHYDFQGAGEYVTLLDDDGTEVQVRQSPIPSDAPGNYVFGLPAGYQPAYQNDELVSCLSGNTAVAAKVGTHRVTYEPSFGVPNASGLQLRIDGKVTTQGANWGDGGSVETSTDSVDIHFPDGKILSVSGSLPLLSVEFSGLGAVSKSAKAAETGLAGDVPQGSWLPRLPNGKSVGAMPSALHDRYVTLNKTFGNAWRVTKSNSLFDYAPGTSTATFTNAAWPVENAKTCSVPNVKTAPHITAEQAEEACKAITNTTLHTSCVFDVQTTGITKLADTYTITERVHLKLAVKPILIRPLLTDVK
jgi:hypothetical protein